MLAGFCLATWLEPWCASRTRSVGKEADVLAVVLGDSGELLAKHMYSRQTLTFTAAITLGIRGQAGRRVGPDQAFDGGHADVTAEEVESGQPKDWWTVQPAIPPVRAPASG